MAFIAGLDLGLGDLAFILGAMIVQFLVGLAIAVGLALGALAVVRAAATRLRDRSRARRRARGSTPPVYPAA